MYEKLPLEIKIKILCHLDYIDVKWIKHSSFWAQYWKNYNNNRFINLLIDDETFKPNPEQSYILDLMDQKKNIFVNAPAGTGKSALIKYFCALPNTKSKFVGVTSTTGISAMNINGSTLHSFLGIGLGKENVEDLYDKIIKNREKRKIWLKLHILIIDEISMLHPDLFDKLEKIARKIRESKKTFGGIQLLVVGDLFQLPCVSESSGSVLIVNSSKFRKCIDTSIELTNIMRQNDHVFKTVLNKIRIGVVDTQVESVLKSRMKIKSSRDAIRPTKLFCTRRSVDFLNEKELNKLANKHEFKEYVMTFSQTLRDSDRRQPDGLMSEIAFEYVIKNFVKNSTTPSLLQVCENTQVMLTYNINHKLVNGSRGVVVAFTQDEFPLVRFICGTIEAIKPIKFSLYHTLRNGKVKPVGVAIQVPLRVAYAMTVHACQGSTLDYASVDLRETFEYGQAYTALSRVRTLDGLFLKQFNLDVIQAHPEALKYIHTIGAS